MKRSFINPYGIFLKSDPLGEIAENLVRAAFKPVGEAVNPHDATGAVVLAARAIHLDFAMKLPLPDGPSTKRRIRREATRRQRRACQ